jgi:type III secretory pathway component EscS
MCYNGFTGNRTKAPRQKAPHSEIIIESYYIFWHEQLNPPWLVHSAKVGLVVHVVQAVLVVHSAKAGLVIHVFQADLVVLSAKAGLVIHVVQAVLVVHSA